MKKILFLIGFLLIAAPCWSVTYDVGLGETYETWLAFHAAITPSPGDIIDGGNGTFVEGVLLNASGNSTADITYQNFHIDGNDTVEWGMRLYAYTYITVDDVEVKDCDVLIRAYTHSVDDVAIAKHVTLSNCTIHDSNASDGHPGVDLRGSYFTITGCDLDNFKHDAVYCIGDYFTFTSNTVDNPGIVGDGDCVQITASTNVVISNNELTNTGNNPHNGIAATGAGGIILTENNKITIGTTPDAPNGIYCLYSTPTIRYNEVIGGNAGIESNAGKIYNNIVRDAVYAGIWSTNTNATIEIYGNISVDSGRGIRANVANKTVTIKNNILAGNTYGLSIDTNGTKDSGYNCFYNNGTDISGVTETGGSVFADPLFTDAANHVYTLKPGSPCINVGVDLGSDYDDAINPDSTWPSGVLTIDQDIFKKWEIGAYVIPYGAGYKIW